MKGLKVARIKGPRGLAGELKVELYLEDSDFFKRGRVLQVEVPGQGPVSLTIEEMRLVGRSWVVRFREVDTRDKAEALRGLELWAPEEELPEAGEGEFYAHRLLGLRVLTRDGRELGVVRGVVPGDVAFLLLPDGLMVPFTEAFVKEVDLGGGVIVVELPEESL